MGISLRPYLNFAGNGREAMTYYQGIFGGDLKLFGFADFGMDDMPEDGLMHGELTVGDVIVMASDAMPGSEKSWKGTRIYSSFFGDDPDTMRGWFDQLASEGTVAMPLEKQAWGDMYGQVKDKYGVDWMFNVSVPEGWSTRQG